MNKQERREKVVDLISKDIFRESRIENNKSSKPEEERKILMKGMRELKDYATNKLAVILSRITKDKRIGLLQRQEIVKIGVDVFKNHLDSIDMEKLEDEIRFEIDKKNLI